MTRAKVKITPLGRRPPSSNRQRSTGGLKKKDCNDALLSWDHDAENCPPNLDYNVIEEIANGVEKMILSWSHLDEGEHGQKTSSVREEEKLASEKETLSLWKLPEENKVSSDNILLRKRESLEEFCVESEIMSDFPSPNQLHTRPEEAALTAAIPGNGAIETSIDENISGSGMEHALSNILTEAVKHSGTMTPGDTQTEKTLAKTAACWYMEASNIVPVENPVCAEDISGLKCTSEGNNTDSDSTSTSLSLHPKRSRESSKNAHKDVSVSGQSANTHNSSPQTPPISERSVKRMQSQEESSNKKLQLSVSKKTRRSEKTTTVPISGASYSEDEDCLKSPKSDCSLLDLTSNSSWNDPLIGSPIRKSPTLSMDGAHIEEFGPWDNIAGHAPVIVSRVTARPDSDLENCTKEKKSFVSFKLWKANKQSESGLEGSGEVGSPEEKPHHNFVSFKLWKANKQSESGLEGSGEVGSPEEKPRQSVPEMFQGSSNNPESQNCVVAEQTIISPQISDLLCNGDRSTEEMEELQIALLECATEYEIKTIEMKMKLKSIKNLKGEPLFLEPPVNTFSDVSDATVSGANKPTAMDQLPEDEMQQLERVKRQVYKLQHQKGCLSKELTEMKKKERQFELQKKSLDAALHKLDRLEWEMVKKEQEVEDWQLRQRHADAQLQDSVMELQRLNNFGDLADLPMDTASLLALLPTLRGFVQTLAQKDNAGGYYSDDHSQHEGALCDSTNVDEIVNNLMFEIQGLQYELNGMIPPNGNVCEEPKPKKISQKQTNVTNKPTTRPSPRLPRDRYPYPRVNAA